MLKPKFTAATLLLIGISLQANLASAAVGRTAGTFNVSNSGAATYQIPIWVPSGPRSIQPNLAFVYNHRNGIGPMGPGWSVAGLSSISRCNRTVAQDGAPAPVTLTYGDAFCLDGQRLRLTSSSNLATYGQDGTTYQTESAEFSNVEAHGVAGSGPAYFTVQRKDGSIYEYGNGGGSLILATGSSTASAWLLSKVSDRSQNSMVVSYAPPSSTLAGASVPSTISWTRASQGATTYNYTMEFSYTANVPQSSIIGYLGGTSVLNQNRLDSVSIKNSGATIKKYSLGYGTSPTTARYRLIQITECSDSAGTDCLSPTTISYQDGQAAVAESATPAVGSALAPRKHYDLNGDGIEDLVYPVGSVVYVAFASSAGFGSPISTSIASTNLGPVGDLLGTGVDGLMVNNGGTWLYYTWNGSSFTAAATGTAVSLGELLLDANGDGLPDLILLNSVKDANGIYRFTLQTRINTSANGTIQFASAVTSNQIWSCSNCNILLYHPDQAGSGPMRSWDLNGDGRQDLSMQIQTLLQTYSRQYYSLLSNGTTYTTSLLSGATANSPPPAYHFNWNSDNCTDSIWNGRIIISGCNGSTPTSLALPGTILTMLDWNSDGRADVLVANGSTLGVYLSTGAGISALQSTSVPYTSSCAYFTADVDGDGLDDLGCWSQTAPNPVSYYLHNAPGQSADLVASITDGYGINYSPTYVAITRGNYTKGSGAIYPERETAAPMDVVKQLSASDGTGGTYTRTYSYAGARLNVQGRGFEGFQSRTESDSRNGLVRKSYQFTGFPLTGAVYQDDLYQTDGATLISHATYTNTVMTLDSTANNQRYFRYVNASNVQSREVGGPKNGQLITTTATSLTFDSYGNLTNLATTVTDNDSGSPYAGQQWTSTTASTITPDAGGNWCLTLPSSTTVTNTAPGVPTITRTVTFSPDTINCRQTSKTTEPLSSTYAVTEVYGFDGFGNVNQVNVTGAGMAVRSTTIDWGTTGQFPVTITNPLGQWFVRDYDYSLGVQTSETDLNHITTSWQYDTFGRKRMETRPDGTNTLWTFSPCAGNCPSATDIRYWVQQLDRDTGNSVIREGRTFYDAFDRLRFDQEQNLDGGFIYKVHRGYDALGRKVLEYVPSASESPAYHYFAYDAVNRPTLDALYVNGSVDRQSNVLYAGRYTTVTDPLGKTTTKISNVAGQLGRSQDHSGYYQNFVYDAFGSLVGVTDSLSNTLFSASYVYGIDAFQTASTDMDLGSRGYAPNALGEITASTDANGSTFNMTYDPLSRPLTRSVSGEMTTWTWGSSAVNFNIGRLYSISSTGAPTETYSYDSKGRVSNRSIFSDATYSYDYTYSNTTGMLDTLTYPISTSGYRLALKYTYQYGMPNQVSDSGAGTVFWQANAANAWGQITQETLGNGLVTNRVFDPTTGLVSSIKCGSGGGTCAQNQSYLFDLVGNLTQRQNNNLGLTENFWYDDLYRLDYSTLNGVLNLDLAYDAMGNITSRSDVAGGAAWIYSSVRKHQLQQVNGGSISYSYDANGNATTRNGLGINWNKYNYPVLINGNGESTALSYDANLQRWKQIYTGSGSTETTIYIGGMLQKVSAAGVNDYRHYIYANGEAVAIMSRTTTGANTTRYLLRDYQGSVVKITNSNGSAVVSESFTAYGAWRNPATWSGVPTKGDQSSIGAVSREGYTGHDALGSMGLNHMNGRVQDAITGRFLSADPYVTEPGNTQNYNRYSYVNNNPMSFTDPSGYSPQMIQRPYDGGLTNTMVPLSAFSHDQTIEEVTATARRIRESWGSSSMGSWMANWQSQSDINVALFNHATGYRVVPVRRARAAPTSTEVGATDAPQEQKEEYPCKDAANAPKGLAAANRIFRNNTDPNRRFTVDASQLTVKQVGPMNTPGNGVVRGSDWFVFGRVDLVRGSGGTISILSNQYNFEQHDVTSARELFRNIETYFGFYAATYGGLTEYWADLTGGNHATDFTFNFTCQPTVGK